MAMKKDEHQLSPVNSQFGQVTEGQNFTHDAVFGEISEDGPNYRNVRTFRHQAYEYMCI